MTEQEHNRKTLVVDEIIVACSCQNIDEVIEKCNRHPLSDEDIERAAKEYAENENSAYTNDYYGFIAGANFAKQPLNSIQTREIK